MSTTTLGWRTFSSSANGIASIQQLDNLDGTTTLTITTSDGTVFGPFSSSLSSDSLTCLNLTCTNVINGDISGLSGDTAAVDGILSSRVSNVTQEIEDLDETNTPSTIVKRSSAGGISTSYITNSLTIESAIFQVVHGSDVFEISKGGTAGRFDITSYDNGTPTSIFRVTDGVLQSTHLLPLADRDLGDPTDRWRSLYVQSLVLDGGDFTVKKEEGGDVFLRIKENNGDMETSNIRPLNDGNDYDIGTSGKPYSRGYIDSIFVNEDANRILGTNANKEVTALSTSTYPSLTELSYLKGTSSNVQTQIDGKQEDLSTVSSDVTVNASLIPSTDVLYSIGSSSKRWSEMVTKDLTLRDSSDMTLKFDHRNQYITTGYNYGNISWNSNDINYIGEVASIYAEQEITFDPQSSLKFKTMLADGSPSVNLTVQGDGFLRTNTILPYSDNSKDLGNSSRRWDNVYATNGTINTSDRTKKKNIKQSDLGLDFINRLEPVSFKWKDYTKKDLIDGVLVDISKTHHRTHYGLISQQVGEVLNELDINTEDFAGFIRDEQRVDDYDKPKKDKPENGNSEWKEWEQKTEVNYGLRMNEFISPLIRAIQELSQKVINLTERVELLEA
eukprot:Lithocolla_globosa_v1_NODE_1_length_16663_cov_42.954359.p2 type:complete len:615 gc:universal NODE_1_length_16663_cov_42.954359:3625-1781(-)